MGITEILLEKRSESANCIDIHSKPFDQSTPWVVVVYQLFLNEE